MTHDDYLAARDREFAEAEAAEAAYFHAQREIDNDPTDVCQFCGFIRPCECDERQVNARHPWPEDPNALTPKQASALRDERFRYRQQLGMKVAVSLLTVAALSFSVGLYTASVLIGDHVKQELQSKHAQNSRQ